MNGPIYTGHTYDTENRKAHDAARAKVKRLVDLIGQDKYNAWVEKQRNAAGVLPWVREDAINYLDHDWKALEELVTLEITRVMALFDEHLEPELYKICDGFPL